MKPVRVGAVLVLVAALAMGVRTTQAAQPLAGKTCSKAGQVVKSQTFVFTCTKSGKKLFWKSKKIVAVKPTPKPTPSVSSTESTTANPSGLAFSKYTVLGSDNSRFRGGEPSLQIAKNGTLWSSEIGPMQIWKSNDKGKTWQYIAPPISIGGADADTAEDDSGRLHVADQAGLDCLFYYRSKDGGKTFDIVRATHGKGIWFNGQGDCNGQKYSPANVDKPWLITWGKDTVYIAYGENGRGALDYSYDGGDTFKHTDTNFQPNGIAADPLDGSLYFVYAFGGSFDSAVGAMNQHKIGISSSNDLGKTFTDTLVVDRGNYDVSAGGFGSLAVDKSHNIYVTWADNSSGKIEIYLSISKDRGKSWSKPTKVSSASEKISILPTIVAGDTGKVAIAWYGSPDPAITRYNAPNSQWYVFASVSLDALSDHPTFEETKVSAEPMHRNSICTHVNKCNGTDITTGVYPSGYEGGIADFFRIAVDPEGMLNVIWTDTTGSSPKDHFARQISGSKIR